MTRRSFVDPGPIPLDAPDLVFVVASANRGQILEGICQRLADRAPGTTAFHYGRSPLPPARCYFFSHYLLYLRARRDPRLRGAASVVLYTHPSYPAREARKVARRLDEASTIVSCSTFWARALVEDGVDEDHVVVALLGANADRFGRHDRGRGAVAFCSRYQPRKSPELMVQLVRAMPHREFKLLGSEWRGTEHLAALEACPNFEYLELDFDERPHFYDGIDVFVSPAAIEGGPVPLVEAMMSNAVPVATRTGIAPDLIRHGVNGFVFEPGAGVDEVAALVESAYALDADVRATVEHVTWDAFAETVFGAAGLAGSSSPPATRPSGGQS